MITGYNTDVGHSDVVFHVQTEDKGMASAAIESLVYVGGQILAKRSTSYRQVLSQEGSREAIVELMDRQHRLMIAEIRGGKYDDQLAAIGIAAAHTPVAAPTGVEAPAKPAEASPAPPVPALTAAEARPAAEAGQSLDQIILDYLNSEAEQEHLVLMMDVDREFALGQSAQLRFRTKGSISGEPVPGTRISVKMISTVSEPMTLASGETDAGGRLQLELEVPDLQRGSSALIVTASSDIGTAEIKHLL